MTHFVGAVIVPKEEAARENNYLNEVLARYDENREVPHWIPKEEIVKQVRENTLWYCENAYAQYRSDPEKYRNRYPDDPDHLHYISEEFPKRLMWTDDQCYQYVKEDYTTIDPETGAGLETHNPESKWDWWVVGGRWKDEYAARQWQSLEKFLKYVDETRIALDAEVNLNPYKYDSSSLGSWDGDLPWWFPHHLVTTDGEWHEIGKCGWFGSRSDDRSEREWVEELYALLRKESLDSQVVFIDFHI